MKAKKKTETKPTGKLRLPASAAHVWAYCGGSAALRDARDPFSYSDEARRGVMVHKVGANKLRTLLLGKPVFEQLDAIETQLYEAEKEDVERATDFYFRQVQAAFAAERENFKDSELFIEKPLIYEDGQKVIQGPPDAMIVSKRHERITVFDLKSGWLEVEAEANPQLMVYAHSAALEFNMISPTLLGVIVQPNLAQVAQAPIAFDPEFFSRLQIDSTRFTVGAHCGGCPSKTGCKAFKAKVDKYLRPEYKDATIDRLKAWPELLEIAKPAEKFFQDIQSQAFAYISAGGQIPGWGLKPVAGRRTWTKETTADALAKAFDLDRSSFIDERLETPAQVDKILKQAKIKGADDKLSSFYYQPSAPRLAKLEHKEAFLTQREPRQVKGKTEGKSKVKSKKESKK